jgi:hypothetical protein
LFLSGGATLIYVSRRLGGLWSRGRAYPTGKPSYLGPTAGVLGARSGLGQLRPVLGIIWVNSVYKYGMGPRVRVRSKAIAAGMLERKASALAGCRTRRAAELCEEAAWWAPFWPMSQCAMPSRCRSFALLYLHHAVCFRAVNFGYFNWLLSDWSDRIFSWDFMSHVQLESLLLPSPR